MKHRFFFSLAALFVAVLSSAQQTLPNDPAVKVGRLDNGLRYYIRHNDKPARRAEFYLSTDVGAFQETDAQDGLAHFLEHMCFNGTKNFPGKSLIEWLQGIGAGFGENINASTGFEETSYMLNNIPLVRETVIDTCLLILHDYSHFVSCLPEEIDAERGVILEERRARRDANWRIFEKSRSYYYGDTPYARRTLIGSEEQLKTFEYHNLTDFYKKWYRPDMQAVIVVGDIDPDRVEQKLKSTFSDIPAPEQPTVKKMYPLPHNVEPLTGILTDPEAVGAYVNVLWKLPPLPEQYNNTDIAFASEMARMYIQLIMSERFGDITSRPDAPFLAAGFGIGNLCETSDAAFGTVRFKEGTAVEAFAAFMTEIEKMKRYGFTEAEVRRAGENILSGLEKEVQAADTRKNADFIEPLLRNFHDNEPFMEPAKELELAKALSGSFSAAALSRMAAQVITEENQIVLYSGPEKEGLSHPSEADLKAVLTQVKQAEIQANKEEVLDRRLLDTTALKGSPVRKAAEGMYGATVWKLKNGLKVVVLPTEYEKDQVRVQLYREGGRNLIATEDLPSFEDNIWAVYLANAGVSGFSAPTLTKLLSGKQLSVSPFIGKRQHGIEATCAPKDLETLFQLIYLDFAAPRFDEESYRTGIAQIEAILPSVLRQPAFRFQTAVVRTLTGNAERTVSLDEQVLGKASLAATERVYRRLFRDVSGMTAVIVGKVDPETLKPLAEKYLGSLPKGKKVRKIKDINPELAQGRVVNHFQVAMETPKTSVLQVSSARLPVGMREEVALAAAEYILDMVYVKTLREEEGGTYGASVKMYVSREPVEQAVIQVVFETNPESEEKLCRLAVTGLEQLAAEGPTAEQLSMAAGYLRKKLAENRIRNDYWLDRIKYQLKWRRDGDKEYEDALDRLSAGDVASLLQQILAQRNFIEVRMSPSAAAEQAATEQTATEQAVTEQAATE